MKESYAPAKPSAGAEGHTWTTVAQQLDCWKTQVGSPHRDRATRVAQAHACIVGILAHHSAITKLCSMLGDKLARTCVLLTYKRAAQRSTPSRRVPRHRQ